MSRPSIAIDREQRTVDVADLEVRISGEGEAPRIEGYAAVFNKPSEVISDFLGHYREIIAPGAFKRTLDGGADVRGLLNHDPNFVLGRSRSGTLRLWEDTKGLGYEIKPPDTQWARDLLTTMRRGDITQSSFAFQTVQDRWTVGKADDGGEYDQRTQLEVKLFDVSPVTYPAYPQTESIVRSLLAEAGIDATATLQLVSRALRGLPLRPTDRDQAIYLIERLSASLPADPAPTGHSDEAGTADPAPSGHSPLPRRVDPVPIDSARAERLRARLRTAERRLKE